MEGIESITVKFREGTLVLTHVKGNWFRCSEKECGLLHEVKLEINQTMPMSTEIINKIIGELPADDKTNWYSNKIKIYAVNGKKKVK